MEPHVFQRDGVSFRIEFQGAEFGWEGRLFIEGHPTLQVVRVLNACGLSKGEARSTIVRGCEAMAAEIQRSDAARPYGGAVMRPATRVPTSFRRRPSRARISPGSWINLDTAIRARCWTTFAKPAPSTIAQAEDSCEHRPL
ncbi:hypothetical protein [Methylobacterium oxalidis]|uniref:Uncharacterized protein n=1 Tax=Methylobacterium oxalidis TaxID=944322 RepID=A0A512J9Z9_9HYPH|nr:hypothetical protein [Methylobacterium oxalidis]GEP06778.1 hypothetical protein MOX02_48160 [Methylobacterium oxalidis]GJE34471.1 hypothetical protein LDDCCGHA_4682 [Methylobacterium oxalidis]GLS67082.1 hypothetical protein GCM10007888_54650 [Methylobacterium oxalidis]